MVAVILTLGVYALFLAFFGAVFYVVVTVREHMEKSPAAAKAIYDHVFLPVFVGTPKPEKAAPPDTTDPGIDLDDLKL